ncbi:MAG TPA: MFS transporter [Solirubrobacteraceae bacterium]|nr:MFS transporter [Solirubrobacteraceae bacterium]
MALPTIGRVLDASSTSLEWIVDAYAIVYASLLIAGGVLSDRQGRKGMFMIGVTVFGLGSLVSGVVPTVGWPTGVFLIPRIPRNRGVAPAPLIDVTDNSMRQIGQALGVAVLGSLVHAGVLGGAGGGERPAVAAQATAFVD